MLWRVMCTLRCSARHHAGTAFVLRADETVFRLIRSHPHAKAGIVFVLRNSLL